MKAALLLLAACSSKSDPPPAPAPIAARDAAAREVRAVDAGPVRLTVHWSDVRRTTGCFFFSGPEGRDDQLVGDVVVETVEREGVKIVIKIGTATFAGTYDRGELSLTRSGSYDYNGPWRTTEKIVGTKSGDTLSAHYTYEECELRGSDCPGHCTIRGTLTFSREL